MLGECHGLARSLRHVPLECEFAVESHAEPSECRLLLVLFRLRDRLDTEVLINHHWGIASVPFPGDVDHFALLWGKGNLIVVSPLKNASHILG